MDLNKEIWDVISSKSRIPDEVQKSLHLEIMQLIQEDRKGLIAKKQGVTIMTPEASLAGNETAGNRDAAQNPGQAKPKTL